MDTRGIYAEFDQMRMLWPMMLAMFRYFFMLTEVCSGVMPQDTKPEAFAYGVMPHTPFVLAIANAWWNVHNIMAQLGFAEAFTKYETLRPENFSRFCCLSAFTTKAFTLVEESHK